MTMSTSPALLTLDGIDAGYGTSTVLRNVSLSVAPGRVTALLGANGAGKTTLLRVASGLLAPSAGRVRLAGDDVTSQPPHRRSRAGVCLIPEGRGIFRHLTVEENLRLQLPRDAPVGPAIEQAVEAFPALGRRRHQAAGSMSGGEQQMLALARAFTTSPRVVLIDELSMGLAPIVVDEMFAAVERLVADGVAMVIVEQYVSRALAVADDAVLLRKGAVSFTGSTAELDEQSVVQDYLGVHQ